MLACPVVTKRKTGGTLAGRIAQRHFLGCEKIRSIGVVDNEDQIEQMIMVANLEKAEGG